jgi:hypothetical protein
MRIAAILQPVLFTSSSMNSFASSSSLLPTDVFVKPIRCSPGSAGSDLVEAGDVAGVV